MCVIVVCACISAILQHPFSGKSETDEYKENLHKLSGCLRGQRGLLFTNSTKDEVTKWFEAYSDTDYARTGCAAEQDVELKEGPLEQFAHSMEPQVRIRFFLERRRITI